ncbi:hypothetical protein [Acinetobacter sp. YH12239]|uniref:hypothetical protein n=1 Tax=Acinetobacter sp. YH12239 TaxID=2601166 RepID=UPI0015D2B55E|nr:hypothetical protein [Acinetobacter sp. YH12239]
MKLDKALLMALTCWMLIACEKNYIYLTPNITGYLYDAETRQPIPNRKGFINFGLTSHDIEMKVTDDYGIFSARAFSLDYWLIPPSYHSYKAFSGDLYIEVSGYAPRFYDYSKFALTQDLGSYSRPSKLDVGRIYLTPMKFDDRKSPEYENCPISFGDKYCKENYRYNNFGVLLRNPDSQMK